MSWLKKSRGGIGQQAAPVAKGMGATRATLVLPLVAELEGRESLGSLHHPRIGRTPSGLEFELDGLVANLGLANLVAIPLGSPIGTGPPIPIQLAGIGNFLGSAKVATKDTLGHGDDLTKTELLRILTVNLVLESS